MTPQKRLDLAFVIAALFVAVVGLTAFTACSDSEQGGVVVAEDMPEIRPNLPQVPQVPPPRFKLQYDDGTWSVYGLRKRIRQNINEEVRVKGYVVKIYQPEPCPEGRTCPPPTMPHLWLGDAMDVTSERQLLRLVGYANSQIEIDQAREEAEKGQQRSPEELAALPPIVYDWQLGKQYIVKGRFSRFAGTGFGVEEGLLEYIEHECLDCPPPEEED